MIFFVEQLLFSKYLFFAAEGSKVHVVCLSILMLLDVFAGYRRT